MSGTETAPDLDRLVFIEHADLSVLVPHGRGHVEVWCETTRSGRLRVDGYWYRLDDGSWMRSMTVRDGKPVEDDVWQARKARRAARRAAVDG